MKILNYLTNFFKNASPKTVKDIEILASMVALLLPLLINTINLSKHKYVIILTIILSFLIFVGSIFYIILEVIFIIYNHKHHYNNLMVLVVFSFPSFLFTVIFATYKIFNLFIRNSNVSATLTGGFLTLLSIIFAFIGVLYTSYQSQLQNAYAASGWCSKLLEFEQKEGNYTYNDLLKFSSFINPYSNKNNFSKLINSLIMAIINNDDDTLKVINSILDKYLKHKKSIDDIDILMNGVSDRKELTSDIKKLINNANYSKELKNDINKLINNLDNEELKNDINKLINNLDNEKLENDIIESINDLDNKELKRQLNIKNSSNIKLVNDQTILDIPINSSDELFSYQSMVMRKAAKALLKKTWNDQGSE